MKKEFKNVNIVILDNGSNNGRKSKEISAKDLARIIENTSNNTIREALQIVCLRNRKRIVNIMQCVHGVAYASYYRILKENNRDV